MRGTVHIIGAGLAGLSAATCLAEKDQQVVIYEASNQAGGRCRSYYDEAFGATIDNGNHLLLSGNHAALAYLKRIGSRGFDMPKRAHFDFIDAQTRQRWVVAPNNGKIPFWLLDSKRRVPGTQLTDYLAPLKLLCAGANQTVTDVMDGNSVLYKRLWNPLLLSALNTELEHASAHLAAAIISGTLLQGGHACMPLIAEGLSDVFVHPALTYLHAHGGKVLFGNRIKSITFKKNKAITLEGASGEFTPLAAEDKIICAVPAHSVSPLIPGISLPDESRAILNVHFRITPPAAWPLLMGVVNATVEWIFAFADRISITVSNADRLMQEERDILAKQIWQEVAFITGLAPDVPPWQIVKEKRATFAAMPAQDAKRPGTKTRWDNLFLAGDYVQTGLPATIEGAIRSGIMAAESVTRQS